MKAHKLHKLTNAAKIIGIIYAVFWIIFGVISYYIDFSAEAVKYSFIISAVLISFLIISFKFKTIGGLLLFAMGMLAFILPAFRLNLLGSIILGIPPLLSGILFLLYSGKVRELKQRKVGPILCFILFCFFAIIPSAHAKDVALFEIDGIINPVLANYITNSFKSIDADKYEAVLIRMDTPGGLSDSMRQIMKDMMNYKLPVIIWVGPKGARAASAGVFIAMASDIAVMAPGTNIGAAHPVGIGISGGESSKIMEEKAVQDAAAYMRSIAKDKGRNWEWAEKAVTKSLSIASTEALDKKVIDYIAKDMGELLKILDGKKVEKSGRKFVLNLKNSKINEIKMSSFSQFLHIIANPNVAFVLFLLGVYGLIFELSSPGIGLGAVVGGVCLILAFFSFQILPVNIAGLLLILLGIGLMFLDLKVASHGVLTAGGLVSFIFGALMLFKVPERALQVSMSIAVSMAVFTALFFVFALTAVIRIHKKKATTGEDGMIDLVGEVKEDLRPKGFIMVHGELWEAISEEKIKKGEKARIIKVEGNLLHVKKEQ